MGEKLDALRTMPRWPWLDGGHSGWHNALLSDATVLSQFKHPLWQRQWLMPLARSQTLTVQDAAHWTTGFISLDPHSTYAGLQ